jgi:hypothetical protein
VEAGRELTIISASTNPNLRYSFEVAEKKTLLADPHRVIDLW